MWLMCHCDWCILRWFKIYISLYDVAFSTKDELMLCDLQNIDSDIYGAHRVWQVKHWFVWIFVLPYHWNIFLRIPFRARKPSPVSWAFSVKSRIAKFRTTDCGVDPLYDWPRIGWSMTRAGSPSLLVQYADVCNESIDDATTARNRHGMSLRARNTKSMALLTTWWPCRKVTYTIMDCILSSEATQFHRQEWEFAGRRWESDWQEVSTSLISLLWSTSVTLYSGLHRGHYTIIIASCSLTYSYKFYGRLDFDRLFRGEQYFSIVADIGIAHARLLRKLTLTNFRLIWFSNLRSDGRADRTCWGVCDLVDIALC